MKNLRRIWDAMTRQPSDSGDEKYETAMRLADDVTAKLRERAQSINPFREVLSDLLLRPQPMDPVLIADAFEVLQESRIYHGPLNGRGRP